MKKKSDKTSFEDFALLSKPASKTMAVKNKVKEEKKKTQNQSLNRDEL